MRITMRRLRALIREAIASGSHPDEMYTRELMNDPAFLEDSVYVPAHVKLKLRRWARDMGLSSK